jgi:hypothetical protein
MVINQHILSCYPCNKPSGFFVIKTSRNNKQKTRNKKINHQSQMPMLKDHFDWISFFELKKMFDQITLLN